MIGEWSMREADFRLLIPFPRDILRDAELGFRIDFRQRILFKQRDWSASRMHRCKNGNCHALNITFENVYGVLHMRNNKSFAKKLSRVKLAGKREKMHCFK